MRVQPLCAASGWRTQPFLLAHMAMIPPPCCALLYPEPRQTRHWRFAELPTTGSSGQTRPYESSDASLSAAVWPQRSGGQAALLRDGATRRQRVAEQFAGPTTNLQQGVYRLSFGGPDGSRGLVTNCPGLDKATRTRTASFESREHLEARFWRAPALSHAACAGGA